MNRAPLAAALLLACGCAAAEPGYEAHLEVFTDASRPPAERLGALATLRALGGGEADPAFRAAVGTLRNEAAKGTGLTLGEADARLCAESLLWLAERGDLDSVFLMELYLDRETARRKPLPERVRVAAARGLGRFPASRGAGGALWEALKDPKEAPAVRSASLESLRAFHPENLRERVLALAPAGDPWLSELQGRLR